MAKVSQIITYCDELLNPDDFKDYAPNGLQVEGQSEVQVIVSGVTATQALIDKAIGLNADMLLVHHGYFWHGEDARLIGMKGRRVKALMQSDISLVGYHLPLDAHPELGNNAQLGKVLSLQNIQIQGQGQAQGLLFTGELPEAMSADSLSQHLFDCLQRQPLHIAAGEQLIKTVAWCTGGAQSFIDQAAALGVDAYISGEISEKTTHEAREIGIHYFAAGHHATERYGVQALGEQLAAHFGLAHYFVDVDNPA